MLMFPVVVVEVMLVVPNPVRAMEPLVPVRLRAPVVKVRPLEAVKSPAEVIVPEPVAEMLPEVVMASPALEGCRVEPLLDQ